MTIAQAIAELDRLKPNNYTNHEKVNWLSRVDSMVQTTILNPYRDRGIYSMHYDPDREMDLELLVPEPYDELYIRYMEAQIDYANDELDRYNNAMALYQAAFEGYANQYTRTHLPKNRRGYKFF